MKFVISDIHGCYDKYIHMLEKIDLRAEDTLYVLGDVLDRGPQGIKIIEDIARRQNVILLCGNHERTAEEMLKLYSDSLSSGENLPPEFEEWLRHGGASTAREFICMSPQKQHWLLQYLDSLPCFTEEEIYIFEIFYSKIFYRSKVLDFYIINHSFVLFICYYTRRNLISLSLR